MNKPETKFSCIILAGGEGKRVGGQDKGLISHENKTLIQHVIAKVKPQVDEIIISANRNLDEYKKYDYQVISYSAEEYRGPLAGIAAALPSCKHDWVLVVPCDMPLLASDTVKKLSVGITDHDICIAESDQRLQLVFLINKKLQHSIISALKNNQLRLMQWVKSQQHQIILITNKETFKNYNHTSDFS